MEHWVKWTRPLPIIGWLFGVFFIVAGIIIAYEAGVDYKQGEWYRIFYVHVPCAWISILTFILISVGSLIYLWKKNPWYDIWTEGWAWSGTVFVFLTLITGSLWGGPTWGTYWVWDARLTSIAFIAAFIVGYWIVRLIEIKKYQIVSATLVLIGILNLPIIKYSVDWWTTLHQPASINAFASNSAVDPIFIYAALLVFFGFFSFGIQIISLSLRYSLLKQKHQSFFTF